MSKPVKTIQKAFDLLEQLNVGNAISLKEIAEKTGLPKPTAFRILNTMQMLGYIDHDRKTLQFRLGEKFLSLIKSYYSGNDVIVVAERYMEKLQQKFGETVNLARLNETNIVYIRVIESQHSFRISNNIGDLASLHSTAIGKALAAFLPEEQLQNLINHCQFTKITRKTIADEQILKNHLALVRQNGYAIDDEEAHDGVLCAGAPIFNKDNLPFAALSISMPKVRAKKSSVETIIAELKKSTMQISFELGVTDIRKCLERK